MIYKQMMNRRACIEQLKNNAHDASFVGRSTSAVAKVAKTASQEYRIFLEMRISTCPSNEFLRIEYMYATLLSQD
jgi:hypothetical protein